MTLVHKSMWFLRREHEKVGDEEFFIPDGYLVIQGMTFQLH